MVDVPRNQPRIHRPTQLSQGRETVSGVPNLSGSVSSVSERGCDILSGLGRSSKHASACHAGASCSCDLAHVNFIRQRNRGGAGFTPFFSMMASEATTANAEARPLSRRRWRFSLRTFFIIVLLLGAAFGWIGSLVHRAAVQHSAAVEVAKLGGAVAHMNRYSSGAPDWMVDLFGMEFFYKVVKVDVDNPQLNDEQLAQLCLQLSKFPDLLVLNIHQASITNSGLQSLTSLPSTVNTSIFDCPISDEGIILLKHFDSSQEMWLVGTNATEQGVANLRKAIPGCAILFDSDGDISPEQMSAHMENRGELRGELRKWAGL